MGTRTKVDGPAEAWARICRETGLQARTQKVGSAFDWSDFAALAEAAIGLSLHERAKALERLRDAEEEVRSLGSSVDALKAGAPIIKCCAHCELCAAERTDEENAARARLIAAAPSLLDALRAIEEHVIAARHVAAMPHDVPTILAIAREAIRKATEGSDDE